MWTPACISNLCILASILAIGLLDVHTGMYLEKKSPFFPLSMVFMKKHSGQVV